MAVTLTRLPKAWSLFPPGVARRRLGGWLFFQEARHQFDQVTWFVGAVQLVDEDLVPSILAGPGGTR